MITGDDNDHSKTFLNISKISKNFKNFKKFKNFKFALISETVRDRAKLSEFPTLAWVGNLYANQHRYIPGLKWVNRERFKDSLILLTIYFFLYL